MELSLQAIRDRVSVRSYDGSPLAAEEARALEAAFAEAVPGPFGRRPRFALVAREDAGLGKGRKLGTYGVIAGAATFLVGIVEPGELACVDFGYAFEGLILRATELGLGTCWVGGIFDRGLVKRFLGASGRELAPALSPVGRAADGSKIRDQLIRRGAGSLGRKPAGELFFEAGPEGAWLPLAETGAWAEVLEAVRVGPSASNKQPWRLILDRRGRPARLHLVLEESRFYNNMLGAIKLQELDMGIAMRHVEVAAAAAKLGGAWKRLEAPPVALGGSRRYIASWIAR